MRALRRLLACVTLLAVAGCAGGSELKAIYTLDAPAAPRVAGATSAQLLVPEPRALEAFATNKIAVKPTPISLAYYPEVAYQDSAPKVVQAILLETFQNTGRVRAVGLPGQSLLINYQIVTEVRAFQAETYEADRARVSVSVKILDDSNGKVVADRVFTAVARMAGDSAEAAARGINAALQDVAIDIASWVLTTI